MEPMKRRIYQIISVAALAALCALIFSFSAQPATSSAETSAGVSSVFCRIFIPSFDELPLAEQTKWLDLLDRPVRKTAHFSEFALLGMLAANAAFALLHGRRTLGHNLKLSFFAGWAFAALWGVLDEVHQAFVPGRACMPGDMLIDTGGALTGAALFTLVTWLVLRRR